jgi:hypothetical protein
MMTSSISSSPYNPLVITNESILAFYDANRHIDFETVNLLVLDLLKQSAAVADWRSVLQSAPQTTSTAAPSPYKRDCSREEALGTDGTRRADELLRFVSQLKEVVHQTVLRVSSQFSALKTQYIQEFRAVYSLQAGLAAADKTALLQANNTQFLDKVRQLLTVLLSVRAHGIAEKTGNMIRQFQTIVQANVVSVMGKECTDQIVQEFVDNFDGNASCMVSSVLQLLADYASAKEVQAVAMAESLRRHAGDGSSTAAATYYKVIYELNDALHQLQGNGTLAGEGQEHAFDGLLSQLFPTAFITRDDSVGSSPEQPSGTGVRYHVLREDEAAPPILFESHSVRDKNVGVQDVKAFLKMADEKMAHGVLISQHTGITGKANYHLEIQHGRILVFLHKTECSREKVQHAVDMIQTLSAKLGDLCISSENKYTVPREVLDSINREYQQFIVQKDNITAMVREQQKKLLGALEEIRFCSLDKFLATRYSSSKKQGYTCDLCNVFNVGTLKGLAAHKRGCLRKQGGNGEAGTKGVVKPLLGEGSVAKDHATE